MPNPKLVGSVTIKKLILEDEMGGRVVLTVPLGGVPLQEGGVLRNISLGALSTTGIINDFKKSRLKLQEGDNVAYEKLHGQDQEKLQPVPEPQLPAGTEAPPVFVESGRETERCSCKSPIGSGRRCLNCGLLISR